MKTYGGVDIWIHVFLISALIGGRLLPWKEPPVPIAQEAWGGGGTIAGLDDMKKKKVHDPTRTPAPQSAGL
jgi:hypothetical protein